MGAVRPTHQLGRPVAVAAAAAADDCCSAAGVAAPEVPTVVAAAAVVVAAAAAGAVDDAYGDDFGRLVVLWLSVVPSAIEYRQTYRCNRKSST